MENAPTGSVSLWRATSEIPHFPSLQGNIDTGVCVIGGGIAGLTTAYLLSREGKDVLLIDAWEIGAGETGRTTAHFFPPDERYYKIERGFGTDSARIVADSFQQATDLVESIVREEGIACDFERLPGYLFSLDKDGEADLVKELAAARSAGVDVEMLEGVPTLSFDTGPCIQFARQAQFHPLKYLAGLAQAFMRNGGRIRTRTRALSVEHDKDRHRQVVSTEAGKIFADAVVVATNTPFNDRLVMHTKQSGYRSYVVGLGVPKGSVPRLLLWDTGDPYYYVRLATSVEQPDQDVLIVGGADHKVGQDQNPEHRYAEIEAWVRERFPMAGSVQFKWSGEVMEPADGPAYCGRNPMDDSNVYIITGDSGNGMTHCTAGAMVITDLIMGRDNPWAAFYDPSRKSLHGIAEFFKEQVNTLTQYTDWLRSGDVDSAWDIAPGQGAVVIDDERKVAVYRDNEGELHAVSAACTHLGCIVSWNSAEKSWDCPCHASRFNVAGQVLHGPAMKPIEPVILVMQNEAPVKRDDPNINTMHDPR